jgi:hypothetical protein
MQFASQQRMTGDKAKSESGKGAQTHDSKVVGNNATMRALHAQSDVYVQRIYETFRDGPSFTALKKLLVC